MRASQFINEALDSDAVNELDSFIMNDEDLYRRRFMPIISNIRRKMKRGVYDHEKVIKLWMYLVDDAAKKYVSEFGSQDQDVKDLIQWIIVSKVSVVTGYWGRNPPQLRKIAIEAGAIHNLSLIHI